MAKKQIFEVEIGVQRVVIEHHTRHLGVSKQLTTVEEVQEALHKQVEEMVAEGKLGEHVIQISINFPIDNLKNDSGLEVLTDGDKPD